MAPCFAAYSTLGVLHSCICCGSASNEAMKQPAGTTCWFAVETQYPLRSSATAQFMHICQVRRVLEYRRSATRRASIYPLLGLATSTRYSRQLYTSVAGTSAGRLYTRTCAHQSQCCSCCPQPYAVVSILQLDWTPATSSTCCKVFHAAPERRASTVLSGKGGCRPLVKCLGYVVRSRCYPCQAVYARTWASQDPAKALCSTRRWTRLAGLVCAAW